MEQVRTALPSATVPSPGPPDYLQRGPFAAPRFVFVPTSSLPGPVGVRCPTQVFGKCLICRDLEVASAFSKSHNLNGITLEGTHYATPPAGGGRIGARGVGRCGVCPSMRDFTLFCARSLYDVARLIAFKSRARGCAQATR